MRTLLMIALATLVACTEFPDFDDRIGETARNAAYPTLQPLAPLIASANALETSGQITPTSVAALSDRIAALQSKANRLRGPIIDRTTLERMRRGVAVPAAIR